MSGLRRLGVRTDARPLRLAEARAARGDEEAGALLLAARAAWARALEAEEATVVSLACEVAKAVLGREAASGDGVLRDVTARALVELRRARAMRVRVHPDDEATMRGAIARWLPAGMEAVEYEVYVDEAVGRGGVVIESDVGRVDGRLERQVAEVARILAGRAQVV